MGIWNLIKLAIIGFLIWTLYKGIKGLISGAQEKRKTTHKRQTKTEVIDVMVQDPQCGTYLPQNEALVIKRHGEELYFCSEECRDAYMAANGKEKK